LRLAAPARPVLPGGRGNRIESPANRVQQGLALYRQANAAMETAEQLWRSEPLFKQLHLPADRAVRHPEFLGGGLEAAAPCRGLEGADGVQRRQQAALFGDPRHDVSFPDPTAENNSFVSFVTAAQSLCSEIST
jgi:hypothetical protein